MKHASCLPLIFYMNLSSTFVVRSIPISIVWNTFSFFVPIICQFLFS
uniref:Macaca fascicularis brain cDNA, clone: QflA-17223 n=1 Tax=Macaca fascicularis TaxID=9541 RepID=I7GL87_MACFA|nr:unnamed protein product [Macaca fascicularis]